MEGRRWRDVAMGVAIPGYNCVRSALLPCVVRSNKDDHREIVTMLVAISTMQSAAWSPGNVIDHRVRWMRRRATTAVPVAAATAAAAVAAAAAAVVV